MTSLAFVLGVLPMAVATGAGSASQRAIGTGVMGGMLSATVLAIYFVPVFFVLVYRFAVQSRRKPAPAAPAAHGGGTASREEVPPQTASSRPPAGQSLDQAAGPSGGEK
jgi:multidrug efflux pump